MHALSTILLLSFLGSIVMSSGSEDLASFIQTGQVFASQAPKQFDGRKNSFVGSSFVGMQDIALLIHVRRVSAEIYEARRPVLMGYLPFFKEIRWLLSSAVVGKAWSLRQDEHPCVHWDPHGCVASAMVDLLANLAYGVAGVLYMHFDVAISPWALAAKLDKTMVGSFNTSLQTTWDTGCSPSRFLQYPPFNPRSARSAAAALEFYFPGRVPEIAQGRWCCGMNDMFYVPIAAFANYVKLAGIFSNDSVLKHVGMEISGPTMLRLSADFSGVGIQELDCIGGNTIELSVGDLKSPAFRCGHKVDYRQPGIIEAVVSLQCHNQTVRA